MPLIYLASSDSQDAFSVIHFLVLFEVNVTPYIGEGAEECKLTVHTLKTDRGVLWEVGICVYIYIYIYNQNVRSLFPRF